MLELIDRGCRVHGSSQVTLNGSEANIIEDILYNLPKDGECRTYICEHGHTHHLKFHGDKGYKDPK